jgi:hypothetical protein
MFECIKEYLTRPPVLRAPKEGEAFKLYVAATDKVLGAVLTQDNAETRYTLVERLYITLLCML